MSHILLEVCVEDASGLRAAIDGGADRIELCSALSVGGLTPSPGLMVLAGKADLPVYAMIRPRPGDFVFDASDIAVMRVEIDAARAAGLAGVVLGASRLDGALDKEALKELADHAQGLGLTLHRAFDLVPDFADAVETAVDLGFERILTSGGAKRAPDGIDHLAAIIADTRDRISIMPGSGVTLETVGELLSRLYRDRNSFVLFAGKAGSRCKAGLARLRVAQCQANGCTDGAGIEGAAGGRALMALRLENACSANPGRGHAEAFGQKHEIGVEAG